MSFAAFGKKCSQNGRFAAFNLTVPQTRVNHLRKAPHYTIKGYCRSYYRDIRKRCKLSNSVLHLYNPVGIRYVSTAPQVELVGSTPNTTMSDASVSTISPSVHAPPVLRECGNIVDIRAVHRHHWAIPLVGFNSILTIPVQKFEIWEEDPSQDTSSRLILPSDIFGKPLRSDILHQCYWYYRRAIAGWTERMQLYKWEWPGSCRKMRTQTAKTGMARMGMRKASGKYLGVQTHPLRPHDQATKINKRLLWQGLQIALSAKYAQNQIKVVEDFLISSHKTKHCVRHLRRLLGPDCNSCLMVHEGETDVNENFRWATAHITAIKRENVEGVNAYTLLRHRQLIITRKALAKLIYNIQNYPRERGWLPSYATPDNQPAPVPEKVPGWDSQWKEQKALKKRAKFDRAALRELVAKWQWSTNTKGPMKVPRVDPYRGFRVGRFSCNPLKMPWETSEQIYTDADPLDSNDSPWMDTPDQLLLDLEHRDREEMELLCSESLSK